MVTGSLPVTLQPGETSTLGVVVKLPGQAGQFTRTVSLQVDDDALRRVRFRVTGRVRKDSDSLSVAESGR